MELNTWQELTALVNDLWTRLQAVRAHDAPLFAFAVVAFVFLEALALGALLDLVLPKHRGPRRRRR